MNNEGVAALYPSWGNIFQGHLLIARWTSESYTWTQFAGHPTAEGLKTMYLPVGHRALLQRLHSLNVREDCVSSLRHVPRYKHQGLRNHSWKKEKSLAWTSYFSIRVWMAEQLFNQSQPLISGFVSELISTGQRLTRFTKWLITQWTSFLLLSGCLWCL